MQIIAHRGLWKNKGEPNSLPALEAAFQEGFGVETDLRSFEGKLYLSHDAILDPRRPPRFEDFLQLAQEYPTIPIFLNIKEDGLGSLLASHGSEIKKCKIIFFDMSVPQLVQYAKTFASGQLSTRVSDYEPVPSGLEFCDWIWVDAFKKDWQVEDLSKLLTSYSKKLTFVSPELHGRSEKEFWKALKKTKISENNGHAICTDLPTQFLQESQG